MTGTSSGTTKVARPATPPRSSDRGRSRLGDITRPVVRERRLVQRRRSTVLFAIAALGISGALATALFVLPVRTYFDQDTQVGQREAQLAEITAVVEDLRSEVARLQTDDGVREAARAELGFVEPGERRETVLDPTGVPTDLPEGWPYDLVENIVELRTSPPPPPSSTPATTP
ncbi:MAG TPA: septum formation initiator family protein [Ilumatobacter sp.]|nr:septum formation initiator family protein [Ilumatobacter sp.]